MTTETNDGRYIISDWEIDDRVVKMFQLGNNDPYTSIHGSGLTIGQTGVKVREFIKSKTALGLPRLFIQKIYRADGLLVGVSIPRKIEDREYGKYKLTKGIDYYRLGTIFIHPRYRNKGYASFALTEFRKEYPNMIWICRESNEKSIATAIKNGFTYNGDIWFTKDESALEGELKQHNWHHEQPASFESKVRLYIK